MLRHLSAAAAAACFAMPVSAAAQDALPRAASIGTNPQGSIYYAVVSGVAQVLSENLESNIRVRPFSGTTQFIPMIAEGDLEMGLSAAIDLRAAYAGLEPWPGKLDLRAIVPLMRLNVSMLVPARSDIQTIEDLRGRRVTGVYSAHRTSLDASAAILANGGLTWEDVEVVPVSTHGEGISAVVEGRADAALAAFNQNVREADVAMRGGVRYLSLNNDPERVEAMVAIVPGADTDLLPKGDFVGVTEDITVLGWTSWLISSSGGNEELIYQAAKAMVENAEEVQAINGKVAQVFSPKAAASVATPVPYHPAAIRYFEEAGLWSEELQARQDELLALQPEDG